MYMDNLRKLPTPRSVSRSLSKARKDAGLTQSEVAKLVGTTQQDISRIECGAGGLTVSTMMKLVQACRCELFISFGPDDPETGQL